MASESEARLQALLDKDEIRDCLAYFSRGMDRFDRDCFLSAFHDDAVVAAGPFVGSAADCYDWAVPMHKTAQIATHHALLQTIIDLDGSRAHAETYYQFIGRNRDESVMMAGGRYIDRFEKRDGRWGIVLRTNAIEWASFPPPMPIPYADIPDIARNGQPSRGKEDPSYRRPLQNLRNFYNPSEESQGH